MRINKIALGLALMLGLSGSPIYSQEHLRIEPDEGKTYQISQADGERDLDYLAKTSDEEDAWLYLNGTWTDVGVDESSKDARMDLDKILESIPQNTPKDSSIVLYHIHPSKVELPDKIYPPSAPDLDALIQVKERIQKDFGLENVFGRVFDGFGFWEYRITGRLNAGDKYQSAYSSSDVDPEEELLDYSIMASSFGVKKINNSDSSREEKISEYLKMAKKSYKDISVTYTPLN
jgi:hypothetical protein